MRIFRFATSLVLFGGLTAFPGCNSIKTATDGAPEKSDGETAVTTETGPYNTEKVRAARIVYVIDHSGSMVDTFHYLREEMKRTLNNLTPEHSFAVVMVSEKVDGVFPKEGLASAVPDTKRAMQDFVDSYRAAGTNDGELEPFADGLRKAFALQPQIIYFLVDGNIDPRIVDEARKLNTNKCKINTIAWLRISKQTEEALQQVAADSNGGKFRWVTEKDLGK